MSLVARGVMVLEMPLMVSRVGNVTAFVHDIVRFVIGRRKNEYTTSIKDGARRVSIGATRCLNPRIAPANAVNIASCIHTKVANTPNILRRAVLGVIESTLGQAICPGKPRFATDANLIKQEFDIVNNESISI